jgi:type VI secretion system secreted protein VgrG
MNMPATYLQENRYLFLETPLGPNAMVLESYTGREAISELFSFQLELLSEDPKIDFAALLGRKIRFGVAGPEGEDKRSIHGIVTAFAQLPPRERVSRYRAVVSPDVWKLTRAQRSRIFQRLAVPDILKAVLQGFDVVYDLRRSYSPREYCVQYRETDFAFLSRLMEEEGIWYFFKQADDGDKLILADTPVSHPDVPGDARIVYDDLEGGEREEFRISDWQKTQCWDSGKVTLRDHCFELPHNHLEAMKEILPDVQVGKVKHRLSLSGNTSALEIYDYPGGYAKHCECGPGNNTSQIFTENRRAAESGMERIEASQFVIRGQSNVYNLIPGYRFTLERHFNGDGPYVITSVTHSAAEGAFYSGPETGNQDHFSNIFTCIPFAVPFRPPCATPRPQVRGCQTAYVVGPSGEEIYTDKYGRVKVQFHWDRDGQNDDKSSCWVRVASFWAGKNWGAIHVPRIGQEVIVDFLEGDPDRPIVVGSVYNAENMPPYALPDNRTQSGIQSRSSKSGGTDNFNQIRFEDKKGSEEVAVQAEKDLNTLVKHDETRTVKHDRQVTVEHDDSQDVSHDLAITVGNNRTITIGKDDTITISGNSNLTITQKQAVAVTGDSQTTITGSETRTVVGSISVSAVGGISVKSAAPVTITAPTVSISAAMVQVSGVVQCTTLITTSVVSPTYTPGAGNIW